MPFGGGQAGGHRGDRAARPRSALCRCRAGGFLQVAALAGGDEPVRAGAGEVGLGQVAGVGQDQADRAVSGAAGRGHRGGGGRGVADHGLVPLRVGGVLGEAGGDDQAVFAGDVLGVVALDEPAAAHRHEPGGRVGDVPLRPAPAAAAACRGGLRGRPARPGPAPARAGPRRTRPDSCGRDRAAARPRPARRRRRSRPRSGLRGGRLPGQARPGQVYLARAGRRPAAAPGPRPGRPASCSSAAARSAASRASRSACSDASAAATRSARVNGSPGSSSPAPPRPRTGRPRPRRPPRAPRPGSAASFRSPSSVRFASFDAFAAIFVPSSATDPDLPHAQPRAQQQHLREQAAAAVPRTAAGTGRPSRGRARARRRSPGTPRPAGTAARSAART